MDQPVTVFRSADSSAGEEVVEIQALLTAHGIPCETADDRAPGVPSGAWEVRVAAADQVRAEELIAQSSAAEEAAEEAAEGDPSDKFDLVTVFRSAGQTAEMEAMELQALLETAGIDAVIVGDSRFPNLAQDVRVPRHLEAEARSLIEEALAAGPAAAEEAEAAAEASGDSGS